MKLKKKHYIWAAVFSAVALLVWAGSDEYFAREWAAFQPTPDWENWGKRIPPGETVDGLEAYDPQLPIEIQPSVLLRTDTPTKKLLLKHNYGTQVFSFDPGPRTIASATESEWQNADGEIARCRSQYPVYRGKSAVSFKSYPDYEATLNGRKLKTYGNFTLLATGSPTDSKVALLSAGGWLSGPGIGFVGLGGADPKVHGQRYLEVMDARSGKFLTEPIRLVSPDFDGFGLCFSSDERFVVAFRPYKDFSVVELNNLSE